MRRLVPLLLVACTGHRPEPVRATTGDLAITDVTIVPMDRDGTVPHQTVVVRGDKIVAIAPASGVELGGATRIDGRGKWLMPGLADMHVHTWSENDLTMFVAAGVTTVRNMFGSDLHLAWRQAIAAGKQLGPTLVTASPIIDGDPPVWPGSIVLTKPDEADAVVARLKAQGYDFLKPYSRLSKPAYDALVAAGKKHGMTLAGHVPREVGLENALAAGQRSVEHLDGWLDALAVKEKESSPKPASFWKQLHDVLPRVREDNIPALVERVKQAGTYDCATLIVTERFAALDDLAALEKHVKWLALIAPETRAQWNPKADFRLSSANAEDFATMRAANAIKKKIVRALAAAGAPLLVGTDTGNPYVLPGEGMHDEIELLVEAGVPRPVVMRAATLGAATFLGERAGAIAVGARADLLLIGVDPLTTPLPLVPDGVVLRGRWLPKSELDAKLAALAAPPSTDRWKDVPPLAPEGTNVTRAHYELESGGKIVGEERLAVGTVDGTRVIVAQMVMDVPGRIETHYRVAGTRSRVEQKTPFGSIVLDAKPESGKLVATGKGPAGALSLSAPLPTGAFLSAPGIGGSFELAATLGGMQPGERRTSTSLELATFPSPSIETATYDITRKPDANGQRVFALAIHFGQMTIDSELVLDDLGVVRQHFGPPVDTTFVRRQ